MRVDRRHLLLWGAAATLIPGCKGAADRPLWSADAHPRDYPTVRAVEHIDHILNERTGGRLSVKSFAGGQLGPERDTLEMTMFGGLDLNRVNIAPLNPIAPATVIPTLPFVFRSVEHMRAAMDGGPGRTILKSLEPHGLKGLCFYDSGARSFYNTKRRIEIPDDMAGLKIRVQNSDVYVAMVEALGGNPTPMSFGEVYQALVQGVVDGAENNWPSYDTTRHFEAAPFYNLTEHVMAPEVLVMSMHRWRKLSDDDRALMLDAANSSVPLMRALWDERVATSQARLLRAGVTVNRIEDKTPFEARMAPVYDRFVSRELRPLIEEISAMGAADV